MLHLNPLLTIAEVNTEQYRLENYFIAIDKSYIYIKMKEKTENAFLSD